MKVNFHKVCAYLIGIILSTGVHAATQQLHVQSGATRFLAVGRPSLLKIHGEGDGPVGELTVTDGVGSGKLEMDLTSLKTGVGMRDDHMKNKYLDVGKYPKATLTLTKVEVPAVDKLPKEVPFEGTLTVHGEPQPIQGGKVTLSKEGDKIKFVAKFQTSITGFKIDIPSYAGIKVAETVDIEVESSASETKKVANQ